MRLGFFSGQHFTARNCFVVVAIAFCQMAGGFVVSLAFADYGISTRLADDSANAFDLEVAEFMREYVECVLGGSDSVDADRQSALIIDLSILHDITTA